MVYVEDYAPVHHFHHLPAGVDRVHAAPGTQIQQSAHHQVHVVPNLPCLPSSAAHVSRHYPYLPRRAKNAFPLLVRMGPASVALRITSSRTGESQ